MAYQPTIRRPSGIPAAPLIMLSGLPKTGKSVVAYELGLSERIHKSWVLDMGEGSADEYGDADSPYEIVEWGRSFSDLRDTIRWLIAQPCPPDKLNAITIDSTTEVWDGLKDRASERAKKSKKNAAALEVDPDYEVDVSMPYWNDAKDTWASLLSPLKLAPHIVGIAVVATDVVNEVVGGVPTNRKVTSYQCEKTLPRVATAHVSVRQDHSVHLVDVRSKLLQVGPNGILLGAADWLTTGVNPLASLLEKLSPTGKFSAPEVIELVDDERDPGGEVAATIDPDQKKQIFDTVASITDGAVKDGVKQAFTRQFGLLADLPLSRFDEAVKWLGNRLGRFDEQLVCKDCGSPLTINMHDACPSTTPPPPPKRGKAATAAKEAKKVAEAAAEKAADEERGDDKPVVKPVQGGLAEALAAATAEPVTTDAVLDDAEVAAESGDLTVEDIAALVDGPEADATPAS